MEQKQTAVEWLFHQLWEEPKDKFTWYAILEQSKQMEKQQIMDAHCFGYIDGGNVSIRTPEQYYNEEYGK